jgi:hypothetical protein
MARTAISVPAKVAHDALPGKSHAMAAKRGYGLLHASALHLANLASNAHRWRQADRERPVSAHYESAPDVVGHARQGGKVGLAC